MGIRGGATILLLQRQARSGGTVSASAIPIGTGPTNSSG